MYLKNRKNNRKKIKKAKKQNSYNLHKWNHNSNFSFKKNKKK